MTSHRNSSAHEKHVQQLAKDIAARLRSVCSHLSDAEFAELVTDIVQMKLRFEVLEKRPGGLLPLSSESKPKDG